MKKFTLLLFLACATFFISCSSDDDNTIEVDESLIPGTWSVTAIQSDDGSFTGTVEGIPISGNFTAEGKNISTQITFLEGVDGAENTFTSSGGFTLEISIEIPLQDPVVVEESFPDYLGSGSWRVEGNNLILTVSGEDGAYTVTSLTADNMSLSVILDEEVDYEGTTFSLDGTLDIALNKD